MSDQNMSDQNMSDQTSATAAQAPAGSVPARALVPMYREAWEANGGPVACDVHPDEVANYRRGGWRRFGPSPD